MPLPGSTLPTGPAIRRRLVVVAGEFDRAAVSRIVERAARSEPVALESESTDERELREAMAVDRMDAETIVDAAAEVGIAPQLTRRSIAIERLGPPPSGKLGDRIVGPREVIAQRTVAHDRGAAVERIDEWLTDGHHLRRESRETPDGSIEVRWVRRSDLATGVLRRMRGLRGEARLGGLRSVTVRAAGLDEATTLVRISADRSDERTSLAAGGAAMVGTGAAGVGLAATSVIVAGPFALLAAPFVVGGALYARRGRAKAERLDHELTRVLDAVAEARRPPGVIAAQKRLKRSIGRGVTAPARPAR